jgi:hypothetical protein
MENGKKRAFFVKRGWSHKDEFIKEYVERAEIEAMLDPTVAGIVAEVKRGKEYILGWKLLSAAGVDFIKIGEASFPYLNEASAVKLMALARRNCHAFDLAQHISGTQIVVLKVTGVDMCPSFTTFGAEILNGERVRPTQMGAPLKGDAYLKTWQYLICKFIVATTTLRASKNDETRRREKFSAFDAVAEAFSRAGHYTTYSQVKSIWHDGAYKEIRELADYLGSTDGF